MVELKEERKLKKTPTCYILDIHYIYPFENVKNMQTTWKTQKELSTEFINNFKDKLKKSIEAGRIEIQNAITVAKEEIKRIEALSQEELNAKLLEKHEKSMITKRESLKDTDKMFKESAEAIEKEMKGILTKAKEKKKSMEKALKFWKNPSK